MTKWNGREGRLGWRGKRPGYLSIGETRSPMHRFLQETNDAKVAAPEYHQQWRTLWKAIKLGYITDFGGQLTAEGRAELARLSATEKDEN